MSKWDDLAPDGAGERQIATLPGDAVFDVPKEPESIWGEGSESLMARGEQTMIYAATGLGKSTLAQRLALSRIGIGPPDVLGYPVAPLPEGERVLYVAADRPRQIMRSMRRMVTEDDRETLRSRWVWETQRQVKADRPDALLDLCEQHAATFLILDSAKDIATGPLKDEEPSQRLVDAWQRCIANGVDGVVLHHPRKGQSTSKPPEDTDEIYGSSMLANSCGSILCLYGLAGSGRFGLSQLKMPASQIPEMDVFVDYGTGQVERRNYRDLNEFLGRGEWVTVRMVAAFMNAKPERDVTDAEKEKARRELASLETKQLIEPRKRGQAVEYRWANQAVRLERVK